MLVQLIILVLCQTAFSLPTKVDYDIEDLGKVQKLFIKFIEKYERKYAPGEESKRLLYFRENLRKINEMNKYNPLAYFDINHFSDLNEEEWLLSLGYNPNLIFTDDSCSRLGDPTTQSAPDALDWRTKNVVSPVKNQKSCGSCWTFSTTGNMEAQYALKYNQHISLSEQQILDCDTPEDTCLIGGQPWQAFTYIMSAGGLASEDSYPYEGLRDTCHFDASQAVVKLSGCNVYQLSGEAALKEVLYTTGPLSISLDASSFTAYHGGLYTNCSYYKPNHAVLLVGYGTEAGVDYWIIKNSWGEQYGEQGYLRIQRGVGCMAVGAFVGSTVVA